MGERPGAATVRRDPRRERLGAMVYHVFGLLSGFVCFWFIVAASQTFEPALEVRSYSIAGAVVFAALTVALFWLGQRSVEGADAE
ncbi:MAG: hypothetical protein NTZ05_09200 [Chloroflexi bacterium]|nr:hypothetical protein [Chloroflexota bacterium]